MAHSKRIALYCVGNRLMLDDGLGPAVYDELMAYDLGESVDVFDLGCLTLGRIEDVDTYDLIIAVDAVDGTGEEPGAIVRYAPQDAASRAYGSLSLHDLKLSDFFASAALLGHECEGVCLGMQVENASPAVVTAGLTPHVHEKVPELVECVLAELISRGVEVFHRESGERVGPGFKHRMTGTDPL